jgi:hypothetical protein
MECVKTVPLCSDVELGQSIYRLIFHVRSAAYGLPKALVSLPWRAPPRIRVRRRLSRKEEISRHMEGIPQSADLRLRQFAHTSKELGHTTLAAEQRLQIDTGHAPLF